MILSGNFGYSRGTLVLQTRDSCRPGADDTRARGHPEFDSFARNYLILLESGFKRAPTTG